MRTQQNAKQNSTFTVAPEIHPQIMNPKSSDIEHDKDVQDVVAALKRASQRARIIAEQTQTYFVVVRDGKLVKEIPDSSKSL